jgi:hypothetical protein
MMTTTKSWLRSWWGLNDGNNIAAPIIDGGNFWFGLSYTTKSKWGKLFWLY